MIDKSILKQSAYILLALTVLQACIPKSNTTVSISVNKWRLNGEVINKNSRAAGLLMNVRMGVYEQQAKPVYSFSF